MPLSARTTDLPRGGHLVQLTQSRSLPVDCSDSAWSDGTCHR